MSKIIRDFSILLLLFLLVSLLAKDFSFADNQSEIREALYQNNRAGQKISKIRRIRTSGNWGYARVEKSFELNNKQVYDIHDVLLKKDKGKWQVLEETGKGMTPDTLYLAGVPAAQWEDLLGSDWISKTIPIAMVLKKKGYMVLNVRTVEKWAVCSWVYGEHAGGTALLTENNDKWEISALEGGVFGSQQLKQNQVPKHLWDQLLPNSMLEYSSVQENF